jgi:serine/threonine-protein kinase PknG
MSNGSPCTQPGCTGTIEDGYCDVCGAPDQAPALVPAGGAAAAAGPASAAGSGTTPAGGAAASSASLPSGGSARVGSASQRLASAPLGSARVAPGSRATRRLGTTSTRMRGARLGAGITSVPSLPVADPMSALMAVAEVPENQRNCPSCGSPVGRSRDGRPGRTEGFCPNCRAQYSFTPKLKPGDLVAGQYEVAGALAHGGLGWVYLARDKNVSDRYVVLKGLLNAGDKDAYEAAIAERQFLAEVEHPLIVEIYNFVMHDGAGYIVMEFVGGTSLKQLLKQRMAAAGRYDAIPLDQSIAYLLEVLPAFQYLHDLGLLYCDFKPDNIIQSGDAVKLIDLGGVRRADDQVSAIYGTVGYQAPEVPTVGPSVASDIYTVGRTLAVLAMEFRGYQSTYQTTLPPVEDTPLFQRYDSYYRFLAKACAPDPADRFGTADEMRVQLLGVLREVVALDRAEQGVATHTNPSLLFEQPVVAGSTLTWRELPGLKVDPHDPQAGWLGTVSVADPVARITALSGAPEQTVEVRLARARAAIEAGNASLADRAIHELLDEDPWEWRAVWMSGLSAMAGGDLVRAQAAFNAVYGQVPGELAPKLALARVSEDSAPEVAEALYQTCARTDAGYAAPAAFGLARIRVVRKDRAGALAALDLVPATSSAFVESRRQRAAALAAAGGTLDSLAAAVDSLAAVTIEPKERAEINAQVLRSALETVAEHGPSPQVRIGGRPCVEPALRDGLEQAYRELAVLSESTEERVRLVDAANEVRRWTLR